MWWEPRTDDERSTAAIVQYLNELYLSPSNTIQQVYGVGSCLDQYGQRVPLIAVDRAYTPSRYADPFTRFSDFLSSIISESNEAPRQEAQLMIPIPDAGPAVRALLSRWDVPITTRIMFSDPPMPLGPGPGRRVWADNNNQDATIGFTILIGSQAAFTTAGHLITEAPCSISLRRTRWLRRDDFQHVGTVRFFNDPKLSPGIDIAIVTAASNFPQPQGKALKCAVPPGDPTLPEVTLFGGRSRRQQGYLSSGAYTSTRSFDGRTWTNCWQVIEIDNGFAQRGDSGGPVVISSTSDPLGHLVCALGVERNPGRLQCGLVQDISSIILYLDEHYGQKTILLDDGLPRI